MLNTVKNQFIRLFFLLIKRWNISLKENSNVLIVSTTGLGDTLWGTPSIRALKENNPKVKIFVLTTKLGKQILENNPYIEEIITYKEPLTLSSFSLISSLRKKKISTVYIFHFSQRLILPICALIGAKQIIGTEKINKGMDFLLTSVLPQKKIHEIDRRLEIISLSNKSRFMDFFLKKEEREQNFFEKYNLKKPIICIHPGAKDSYKCWPKEYFIETAKELQKQFPHQILITGGAEEKELVTSLQTLIPNSVVFKSPISIRSFAALLEQVDLLITNDTGPLHLACSLKVPVIAPFSPTDPILCGPISQNDAIAITKNKTCFPCLKRKCLEPFCLLQISPSDMVNQAKKILLKKYAP